MSKTNPIETLGDRMKAFESITTSTTLMPHTPVYARIDGRAFHTFCRGFEKPFSRSFVTAMQETCKELVVKTGAIVGFVQSDEISLGWEDYTKAPFNGRLFKLQSVLASIASTAFVMHVMQTKSAGDKLYDATVNYREAKDLMASDNNLLLSSFSSLLRRYLSPLLADLRFTSSPRLYSFVPNERDFIPC